MSRFKYSLGALGFAAALLGIATCAAMIFAPAATAAFEDYGIESVAASLSTTQAGAHPDFTTLIGIKTDPSEPLDEFGHEKPFAATKEISVRLPPGLVGNPNAVAHCTSLQFATAFVGGGCPQDSQVGVAVLRLYLFPTQLTEPIYSLEGSGGDTVARLGTYGAAFPVVINVGVRSGSDYGLTATVSGIPANELLVSAETTLWGVPADPSHDTQRLTAREGYPEAKSESPPRPSGLAPAPFMTNATSCGIGQGIEFGVRGYPLPDRESKATAALPEIEGCEKLGFDPEFRVTPASRRAGAPTGLEADLFVPQDENVGGVAASELRNATVTLPEDMAIAPGAADGLAACSSDQVGFGEEGASHCPDAAKIGGASFVSPPLPGMLKGAVYQRTPEPGHLFRLWLVADELGVHLKIPGEVRADPNTGRLTSVFIDTPQLPVEDITLDFKGGARAPLKNPDSCGTSDTEYEFAPWSGNAPAMGTSPMTIDEGCGGGDFSPQLKAGTANPVAGALSPFVTKVMREDGEQNVAGLDVTLPPGELAKLAGVPLCPDAEAATGSCPAGSRVGAVNVAVGPGSLPLWLPQPGKDPTAVYLSGPYKGAPYSLAVKVPAQAGPFDLGTVVTRAGIYVDQETTRATVKSDPLPQILEGVPVTYRTINVDVDRPNFALNPTDCETMAVDSQIRSNQGATANPRSRFQVGSCGDLGFKPKLALKLHGKTTRGAHPALSATLRMPKHGANIGRAVVALPRSEFLDQGHIDTVCTRVQFAAEECPAGAIYGHARAVTPLLDEPLEGPVYLRSSNHELPDLVADLRGQIHVVLDGRIDSINGGIRTTFANVPDAPVSRFTLTMKGRAKGLLVNSTNLCRQANFATANFTGQNGKVHDFHPALRAACGG